MERNYVTCNSLNEAAIWTHEQGNRRLVSAMQGLWDSAASSFKYNISNHQFEKRNIFFTMKFNGILP